MESKNLNNGDYGNIPGNAPQPEANDRGSYDGLFNVPFNQRQNDDFDPVAWGEQKQATRQELYDTIEEMADKTLADPDALSEYLNMQARMGKMSVANTLLTVAQKPEATYAMSFDDWQQKGRSVRKGEKGFMILEANGEYEREDGTLAMSFDAKRVFDVAQTYGKPLRERTVPTIKSAMKALTTDSPVAIQLTDDVSPSVVAEYYEEDNSIHVARGCEGKDLFFAISRELARAEQGGTPFLCDCAANIACLRYGVPTRYCDRVPNDMAAMEPREKRGALGMVREAACSTIERVDRNLYLERQQVRNQPER